MQKNQYSITMNQVETQLLMKRLLLLRHGHAVDFATEGDHQRPLSERGQGEAAAMAVHIKDYIQEIKALHVSTARRTQETAAILCEHSGLHVSKTDDDRLYLPTVGDLLSYIYDMSDAQDCALLIGHNPGLYELVNQLRDTTDDTLLRRGLPTCGLIILQCDVEHWKDVASQSAQILAFTLP